MGFLDLCHHELKVREYVQNVPTVAMLARDVLAFKPKLMMRDPIEQQEAFKARRALPLDGVG